MAINYGKELFTLEQVERLEQVTDNLTNVNGVPDVKTFVIDLNEFATSLSIERLRLSGVSRDAKTRLDDSLSGFDAEFNGKPLAQKNQILTELQESGNAYIKNKSEITKVTDAELMVNEKISAILSTYYKGLVKELRQQLTQLQQENVAFKSSTEASKVDLAKLQQENAAFISSIAQCQAQLAQLNATIGPLVAPKLSDEPVSSHQRKQGSMFEGDGGTRRNRRRRGRKSRK